MCWVIPLVIAFIPFSSQLQYIYTNKAIIPGSMYFGGGLVDFEKVKNWSEDALTFDSELRFSATYETLQKIRSSKSWYDLQAIFKDTSIAQFLTPSRYFG